jgi:hypothetical protein
VHFETNCNNEWKLNTNINLLILNATFAFSFVCLFVCLCVSFSFLIMILFTLMLYSNVNTSIRFPNDKKQNNTKLSASFFFFLFYLFNARNKKEKVTSQIKNIKACVYDCRDRQYSLRTFVLLFFLLYMSQMNFMWMCLFLFFSSFPLLFW